MFRHQQQQEYLMKSSSILSSSASSNSHGSFSLRRFYLGSLGVIFLIAFLSYYEQYPGLSGKSGILPADNIFQNHYPNVYETVIKNWKIIDSTDTLCDVLCLIGITCSCVIIHWSTIDRKDSRQSSYGVLFLLLTSIYSFLRVLGDTFYSFQWDILLLETGTLTAVCYVPFWNWIFNRTKEPTSSSARIMGGTWPLRCLLFKLMFMSGVVKIQANCPTWLNLTALEYHFATQPLPNPMSWYAHQIHPFFLRLSVAATFVVEIPIAFLLIVPFTTIRRFAATLQISLQIVILLTGNYTFFNLLTIVLCIPCFENDRDDDCDKTSDSETARTKPKSKQQIQQQRNWSTMLQLCFSLLFLVVSCMKLFRIEQVKDNSSGNHEHLRWNIRLLWTPKQCDEMINQTVPLVVPATMVFLTVTTIMNHLRRPNKNFLLQNSITNMIGTFIHLGICVWCIGIISMPLVNHLTPKLRQTGGYLGSNLFVPAYQQAQGYALTSGYGLFRRMTGVGDYISDYSSKNNWGWAGLPPSIVSRPELILEAKYDDDDDIWHELNFKWKPGNLTSRPKQIAPHHARLDWQMWFAALGHYQHDPWILSLIDKLLQGCQPVVDLIDIMDDGDKRLPSNIKEIRVQKYIYDFTRVPTEWNQRIPNVDILSLLSEEEGRNSGWSHYWWVLRKYPDRYWTRNFDSEYLPPLERDNPSFQQFLSHHGYNNACVDASQEEGLCEGINKNLVSAFCCKFTSWIRRQISSSKYQLIFWTTPFIMILILSLA